jgi:hypothetical protein
MLRATFQEVRMSKLSLIAAALLAISGAGATLAATSAWAQDMAQNSYDRHGRHHYYDGGSDGGLGRYCPPGYYPHSFPNSNGVRCEAQDGRNIYSAPF